jgi:hypothetical protein
MMMMMMIMVTMMMMWWLWQLRKKEKGPKDAHTFVVDHTPDNAHATQLHH